MDSQCTGTGAGDGSARRKSVAGHPRASVWIDPIAQRKLSAFSPVSFETSRPAPAGSRPGIDEIDTMPLARSRQTDEIRQLHGASWTAGGSAHSPYAQRIVEREQSVYNAPLSPRRPHLLDPIRWWLLYPGRIELLFWSVGVALLILLTVTLLPLTVLSLASRHADANSGTALQATATPLCTFTRQRKDHCAAMTITSPGGLTITLLNAGPPGVGTPLELRGQGFSREGRVTFSYDAHLSCQPAEALADAHGAFLARLLPGNRSAWEPGWHQIIAYDVKSKKAISLPFMLLSAAGPPEDVARSA